MSDRGNLWCPRCLERATECVCNKATTNHIDSPAHYTFGEIEVIDVIEDWELGFHLGNAVKYIARAGKKDPDKFKEDLEKAIWYLQRKIDNES